MNKMLTIKEVAEMLGYHTNHIYVLIRNGKLKSKKVLGRVYVEQQEIESILGGNDEANSSLPTN